MAQFYIASQLPTASLAIRCCLRQSKSQLHLQITIKKIYQGTAGGLGGGAASDNFGVAISKAIMIYPAIYRR